METTATHILLSLPPHMVKQMQGIDPRYCASNWYFGADPIGAKLGSGGGTISLIDSWLAHHPGASTSTRRILIHGCGQSRRLPAYATEGKLLTPIPVMRWARGQRIDQNLLDLQLPFYQQVLANAHPQSTTLIASGDVVITATNLPQQLPDADVVCLGIWAEPERATHHGVFVMHQSAPDILKQMLQKPTVAQLDALSAQHMYLMDSGLWLLSERAIEAIRHRCTDPEATHGYRFFDLYTTLGRALGSEPTEPDSELSGLSVAVIPLQGEFYHFGTTADLLASTTAMQNSVTDQRLILQRRAKPSPSLFVQNCSVSVALDHRNSNIWVERAHIGANWQLTHRNVVTGVPVNDWHITLSPGICIDIEPTQRGTWIVRPYGFTDTMRGTLLQVSTTFIEQPLQQWVASRNLNDVLNPDTDIFSLPLFPEVTNTEDMEQVLRFMLYDPTNNTGRDIWLSCTRHSAEQIPLQASVDKMVSHRRSLLRHNLPILQSNHNRSVYYQLDLEHLAATTKQLGAPIPPKLDITAETPDTIIANYMLRWRLGVDDQAHDQAYTTMRQTMIKALATTAADPRIDTLDNQIVWARSPVRIDLAGGWTDTPPYSLRHGGTVVNMAVELNGQPPLQVFVKAINEPCITLRSIDLSADETITTYDQLCDYARLRSPFSIPKAALSLAGFAPEFAARQYSSLHNQLKDLGHGLELTMLSAVPAGSGLGTSSILATTVLGALNNFLALKWDANQLAGRTLALEQLLTSGGGWQDQYGGLLGGIKILETAPGMIQTPSVNWLPDGIFRHPDLKECHLLYFTGITRTARSILGQIVDRMMLNHCNTLRLLNQMRSHAHDMALAIQQQRFDDYGLMVSKSWDYNRAIDSGTLPPALKPLLHAIEPYTLGYKLTGAGGGGFLYMVARDPEAAATLRYMLTNNPMATTGARLVEMNVVNDGMRISRS